MAVRNRLAELHRDITGWRRELHQHPELGFDTYRTADFVKDNLQAMGCDEVVTGIGRTGVVGVIHGKVKTSGRVIGLRADMDALPIHEATGAEYASRTAGKMHACGHDGHTAMLLGAARYLAETRNFNGTLAVIFQPAEEGGAGGKEMLDDNLMDRFGIQEVYGMHNMPGLAVGEFAIRSGSFFAAADSVTITVNGKGGHGAMPHKAADTVLAASSIVSALQSVVSRNIDPLQAAVVSICAFRTDTEAHNVIPQRVKLLGTIRSIEEDVRQLLFERVCQISSMTADSFNTVADVRIDSGYPVMVNGEAETQYAAQAARRVTGVVNDCAEMVMGAEDFAFMLNARPGAYILTGNGETAPLHHPNYDFSDEVIPYGCSWWVEIAEARLPVT
ncbi:MAG: M20 family metallopeptidase [Rhodobacteraceae bacterium]|nr:M20 family metallopeptidase [Paracoccaceae bacterium]MCY4197408.1 M20 family metallopeptidase [Paracoccaceae bacterium]